MVDNSCCYRLRVLVWLYLFIKQVTERNSGESAEDLEDLVNQQNKIMEGIFIGDDKDKDGVITHAEFSGPKHDEL